MALAGNQGTTQAADKAAAKARKLKKTPAPAPPQFPTKIPVRPGAPTNRFKATPSTQAQRTHVHKARIARNKALKAAQTQHDVPTDADLGKAAKFNAANSVRHKQSASDIYLTDPAALKAAGFKPEGGLDKLNPGKALKAAEDVVGGAVGTGFGGAKIGDLLSAKVTGHKARRPTGVAAVAQKVATNLGKDLVDIPASVVPSAYELAKHPKDAPKNLAEPFVQLAKHPGQSFEDHPLGSALMVSGAEGALGRGLGKGLRTIPSKGAKRLGSVERPAATRTVPGTSLTEPGKYSKDIFVKGVQAATDKVRKREPGVVSDAQIKKRVDEHMAANPGAVAGHFGVDFGVKGRSGKLLAIHGRDNALAAAEGHAMPMQPVPLPDSGGRYALVPRVAAERLAEHVKQNAPANTTVERALELYNRGFRKNVLAVSPKWMTGNVVEAATRSLVAHAGPRSYYTAHRALSELKRVDPEAYQRMRAYAMPGGQAHMLGATEHTAAETLAGTRLADVARAFSGGKPAQIWHAYTRFVFDHLNGRIESQFQKAQLGKALRDSKLMSDRTVKVSQKAIDEAAQGMRGTEAQVQLAREVDRMYGQYHRFSPSKRHIIRTYTPFAAWTLNAVKFLADVLPRDHPVLTGLLSSANQATEEWRKDHGLVATLGTPLKGALPGWLRGSIPGKKGSHLRVSRYTPFGLLSSEGGAGGTVASALLPQIMSVYENLGGKDWKGAQLGKGEANNYLAAAVSLIENTVPGANIEAQLSGKHLPNEAEHAKHPKSLAERARRQFDPFMYTAASSKPIRKTRKSKKPFDILDQASGPKIDILDGPNTKNGLEILP